MELDFLKIGVIVASFMSLGTDPVVREWYMIGLIKIVIGLVTCMAKESGSISEQLWVASRRELISESEGRINSQKE